MSVKTTSKSSILFLFLLCLGFFCAQTAAMQAARWPKGPQYTNSLGMDFVQIKSGQFRMGRLNPADELGPGYSFVVDGGDWDEKPIHTVTISSKFYIMQTEVTAEQYNKFDSSYSATGTYATGLTWHQAVEFARWLSKKEGRPYRLVTEAEWEYVCRAGTTTLFWSGDKPPAQGSANPWNVKNMHTGPSEWVMDFHGTYLPDDQTDPVGADAGMIRVIRGGSRPYDMRSASRRALPPGCAKRSGFDDIGFRLVIAKMPTTPPAHVVPFPQECVKQNTEVALYGPDPGKPYFNRRPAMPIPPENDQDDIGPFVGVHPAVLAHCHSPGFVALPNGDLLAVYFSSSTATTESDNNTTFAQARLRFGAEQWDMADLFVDFANMNDQSALLWNDDGKIWFYAGGRGWPKEVPFKTSISTDNAATWTEVKLPYIEGEPGKFTPQPITVMFRDTDNNIYFTMDGSGASSLLWTSSDEGNTWIDAGGRTQGRHSAVLPIKDENGKFSGTLLCLGTKKGHFGGNWMQQNISRDWGKTWEEKTKAPFPYLSSNQRGCLRRLQSGKLVFVSDHQAREGQQPEGYTDHGCFIAISDDEGKSWHVKTIPGTLTHEGRVINAKRKWTSSGGDYGTVGYVTVSQSPNGIIHVLTTMNQPCMHFEFNEAWIYSDAGADLPAGPYRANLNAAVAAGDTGRIKKYVEKYPDGKTKAKWTAKITEDGRYLLHGPQRWYYPNGKMQHRVDYVNGRKFGIENYWTPDGIKRWSWYHGKAPYRGKLNAAKPPSVWTHYWPNGKKKSESVWVNFKAEGTAKQWDRDGKLIKQIELVNGILAQ